MVPQIGPEGDSPEDNAELQHHTISAEYSFSGPVPHPRLLEHYERITPGLANRLVQMAEAEADHRRNMQAQLVESQCKDERAYHAEVRLGQILAAIITLAALIAGSYVAMNGHEFAGSVLGTGGIGGIVVSFILGRNAKQPEAPKPAKGAATKASRRMKK